MSFSNLPGACMLITLSPAASLHHADCRDALRTMASDSLDSAVTDPPYALTQASRNGSPRNNDPETPFGRTKLGERGFMGKTWDTGETAFSTEFWAEVLRVLKPGGHVAAFGASRGYHRMACAIEDAGFEIRDSLMWVYGTGFPKSHDVSKGIDAALGVAGSKGAVTGRSSTKDIGTVGHVGGEYHAYVPGSPEALAYSGFGTALKPAFEPIVLARKPLSELTVAANVIRWRTGALNIGAGRVGNESRVNAPAGNKAGGNSYNLSVTGMPDDAESRAAIGRWPANVVHDGSDEVVGAFPVTGGGGTPREKSPNKGSVWAIGAERSSVPGDATYCDSGSAARFFYSAKASKQDRNGSKHPTVKPIALMEWLCTLITPPGGTVLDPFAGSGTTGIAATNRGFRVILCEREAEYVGDIRRRFGGGVVDLEAVRRDAALRPALAALQARLMAAHV